MDLIHKTHMNSTNQHTKHHSTRLHPQVLPTHPYPNPTHHVERAPLELGRGPPLGTRGDLALVQRLGNKSDGKHGLING